jgi:hypothetical protein
MPVGSQTTNHGTAKKRPVPRPLRKLPLPSERSGVSGLAENAGKQFLRCRDGRLPDALAGVQTPRNPVIESRHTQ